MNWSETVRTAYEAIRTRRLRSGLTVLGILIGIAAVMLTVGLGQGAQAKVAAQINQLGSNLLIVSPGSTTSSTGVRGGRGSATTLTSDDAAMLADKRVAPDVAAVAPVSTSSQSLTVGTTNWTTSVVGTTPDWLSVRARTMSSGRFITQGDLDSGTLVTVIGGTTATQLYGGRDPVGQSVTINNQTFTVIGVLASVGSSTTSDEDDQAIVPRTTFATRVSTTANSRSVSTIYLQAADQNSLSAAYQEADAALLTSHGVTATAADFTVNSQQSLVATATSTAQTLTVLLAGIAGISLLVGGIGVINIMLVSVTERIREIGLRKALGATPRVIQRQFLVEASLLGLVGGLLGIGLGLLGGALLPRFLDQPVTISPIAAVGALAVALVIGVAAGVYPANRAARLAPIDALRNE
ncbi:ABC transporter permease [Lapillicoccus sp.]|uniref:ABC transporter permease n=1 Tax=Lapillicoccus sp. TaxID=1909287 RepID=UPI0025CCD5EA|nr:ABC transporter permease [Lapillicoccus sp.]